MFRFAMDRKGVSELEVGDVILMTMEWGNDTTAMYIKVTALKGTERDDGKGSFEYQKLAGRRELWNLDGRSDTGTLYVQQPGYQFTIVTPAETDDPATVGAPVASPYDLDADLDARDAAEGELTLSDAQDWVSPDDA